MLMINLILILLVGGIAALISQRLGDHIPRKVALAVVGFDLSYLLFALTAMPEFETLQAPLPSDPQSWLMHFSAEWIPAFGIKIELAVDGLSLLMVLLTLILGAVAVSASWTDVQVRRGFFEANLLWTLAGVLGVFMAMDLFLFFLFWERLCCNRFVPVFFILGGYVNPDVFYDCYLGPRKSRLRSHEILYFYSGQWFADAGVDTGTGCGLSE